MVQTFVCQTEIKHRKKHKKYLTSVSYQRTEGAHLNNALFYACWCVAQAYAAGPKHLEQLPANNGSDK